MHKLTATAGIFALTMSLTVTGWAANPCRPIAIACMKLGYYKGGDKVGKGLVKNCVMPVVAHNKILANTNFSDSDMQLCRTVIMQKMKAEMHGN
ncbi:MAG: hypothetical protein ACHP65_03465 [Legionellales bacterium]